PCRKPAGTASEVPRSLDDDRRGLDDARRTLRHKAIEHHVCATVHDEEVGRCVGRLEVQVPQACSDRLGAARRGRHKPGSRLSRTRIVALNMLEYDCPASLLDRDAVVSAVRNHEVLATEDADRKGRRALNENALPRSIRATNVL